MYFLAEKNAWRKETFEETSESSIQNGTQRYNKKTGDFTILFLNLLFSFRPNFMNPYRIRISEKNSGTVNPRLPISKG